MWCTIDSNPMIRFTVSLVTGISYQKFKEDLTELEDTNKKLQATNEKLKGDLVDANEKLAKLQGVKDELSGLKLNLVSLLEGHEATPSAAASGVASPVGAENGACTGAVAATVSPAASSPPAAMHQDKTQSTAVEWTAEKMRNLYYAVPPFKARYQP